MRNKLTKKQLLQLRKEITLNSLYLNDYTNSLNIDIHDVCNFFDSYLEYLQELMQDDNIKDDQFLDYLSVYDTDDNLYRFYKEGYSTLTTRSEPIASYCLSNNASINIYEIVYGIDDSVKWSLNNRKINTSKIRYNDESDYFIAYGRKIPLNECMRLYEK